MNNKLDTLWNEMIRNAKRKQSIDCNIIVCEDKKEVFLEIFYHTYTEFKQKHMSNEVVYLDRHKVAAILIYSVIKTKIMEYKIKDDNSLFLENYYLAFSTGLSYMQYEANLAYKGQNKPVISKFQFPDVLCGNKSYKEHIISMLYAADAENNLNIFELANILFLLEINNINMAPSNQNIIPQNEIN